MPHQLGTNPPGDTEYDLKYYEEEAKTSTNEAQTARDNAFNAHNATLKTLESQILAAIDGMLAAIDASNERSSAETERRAVGLSHASSRTHETPSALLMTVAKVEALQTSMVAVLGRLDSLERSHKSLQSPDTA